MLSNSHAIHNLANEQSSLHFSSANMIEIWITAGGIIKCCALHGVVFKHLMIIYFSGDNVDCWMEIQQGKGPWASPVTGIVPLGTTLTMVVGIDDKEGMKIVTLIKYIPQSIC